MNDEWIINGKIDEVMRLIKTKLDIKNISITPIQEMELKKNLEPMLIEVKDTIQPMRVFRALHTDKNITIPHLVYPEYTKNEGSVETILGYRTNSAKAIANDNYGNIVLVNKFEGDYVKSYDSTLLAYNKYDLRQIGEEKFIIPNKITLGGYYYGHHETLLSEKAYKFLDFVGKKDEFMKITLKELNLDLDSEEVVSIIFKSI